MYNAGVNSVSAIVSQLYELVVGRRASFAGLAEALQGTEPMGGRQFMRANFKAAVVPTVKRVHREPANDGFAEQLEGVLNEDSASTRAAARTRATSAVLLDLGSERTQAAPSSGRRKKHRRCFTCSLFLNSTSIFNARIKKVHDRHCRIASGVHSGFVCFWSLSLTTMPRSWSSRRTSTSA
jgi:hypothetical protein